MKLTRIIIPLLLGIAGGVIASMIIVNTDANKNRTISEMQLAPSAGVYPVVNRVGENSKTGGVDLREAAKKAVVAVVNVKTIQMGKEFVGNPFMDFWFGNQPQVREVPRNLGIGSGVIISEDGYIITNSHVIEESDRVMVTLNDRQEYDARIIGVDKNTDIALLKIDANNLSPMEYGNSDDVELGEWVLAVGNPYNLTSTVTAGIISAKARGLGNKMNLESFLQTDAAVNQGNSGGALVDANGDLIGINTAIQSPTGSFSGYAFAIPVNIVRKVIGDLKEYGQVQRAIIGISMRELTPAVAEELGLKERHGIYVAEVVNKSGAQKAGIKVGDVIQKFNGVDVNTSPEFYEQLAKYTPGNTVQLSISRGGKVKQVDVVLQNSYGETSLVTDFGVLGVKVVPLTQEEQYRYNLKKGVKITELKNGKFKSAGLREGYIIVRINTTTIYDEKDLERAIKVAGDEGVFVTAVSPKGRTEYFAFSLLN